MLVGKETIQWDLHVFCSNKIFLCWTNMRMVETRGKNQKCKKTQQISNFFLRARLRATIIDLQFTASGTSRLLIYVLWNDHCFFYYFSFFVYLKVYHSIGTCLKYSATCCLQYEPNKGGIVNCAQFIF